MISSDDLAVGAHHAHLSQSEDRLTKPVECIACHIEPDKWDSDGHISGDAFVGTAELTFSFPADADSSMPVYDYTTGSCSSVYCHGGKEAD